uniref:Serpentine receptor class gamma n=1 Tax=Panagrellus redivivus TaxID=6233 RepID=A0A7E4WBN2_PANRE
MYTLLSCGIICVILIIGTIIATRFNPAFNGNSMASKIERRLLLQCSVSTTFFAFTVIFVCLYTELLLSPPDAGTVRYIDFTVNIYIISLEIVYGTEALMLLLIR